MYCRARLWIAFGFCLSCVINGGICDNHLLNFSYVLFVGVNDFRICLWRSTLAFTLSMLVFGQIVLGEKEAAAAAFGMGLPSSPARLSPSGTDAGIPPE